MPVLTVMLCLVISGFSTKWDKRYNVTTNSMAPTLLPGDSIFAKPFDASSDVIGRNQLVMVRPPRTYGPNNVYPRRVIAIPGDDVLVFTNCLIVNGTNRIQMDLTADLDKRVPWHLAPMPTTNDCVRYHLGNDQLFVINDNLEVINDSRCWGAVGFASITGLVEWIKERP